jgi:maltose alpha-D-glucosyltransferase / alpha-amylase
VADHTAQEDSLWYKDAVIYELHPKAYFDSNGDGIGDFRGLKERIPYLEDLGVTAIWLLPFYPSPLKDDGYDISDYFGVHPDYGTVRDFRDFLQEAHRHGMRVITELVLNHTSDQNPWFQKSRRSKPGSRWREFYIWSDTPDRYRDARIIFKDFETSNWAWDPLAGAYYFHRFYSHQPDLNYDNPDVRETIFRVMDFWLGMGVDGLRLDAVPYLFKREGTNCENLPETYAFLRELRAHIDSRFKDRMLLAEANQWPEDAVAYFGNGDMCQMAFHFPLMPRLFMGLQMEDRFPIIDILEQTPNIPETCQWALFLRNHDELTLEMVTDEERDYMYRVYARDPQARINLGIRRRLAPLLDNDRNRMELIYMILFSLPGTPVIYYGNEIGMGDNYYLGDRNGVRTPMQWSPDRNGGFSKANPQKLYLPVIIDPEYHYESVNVENQQRNPSSFLWWIKRTVAMRKKFKAFGRAGIEFLLCDNPKVFAFLRSYGEERIIAVFNLSKYFQVAEFDLSKYAGFTPEEMGGQTRFPLIRETPYVLTFGPHDYLLLQLKTGEQKRSGETEREIPELHTRETWNSLFEGESWDPFEEEVLPAYLRSRRWFAGKAKTVERIKVVEHIPMTYKATLFHLLFLQVAYAEGTQDIYLLPLSLALTKRPEEPSEQMVVEGLRVRMDYDWLTVKSKLVAEESPESVIARLFTGAEEGILYDAVYDSNFREGLLIAMARRRRIKGREGILIGHQGAAFRKLLADGRIPLKTQVLKGEQSNTSILYEDKLYFKLFRHPREGINPDEEVIRFLSEKVGLFQNVAPFSGSLEYQRPGFPPMSVGLLQALVANQGDAWTYTLDAVRRYLDRALSKVAEVEQVPNPPASIFDANPAHIPGPLGDLLEGHYLEMIALLGKRTAEMHLALASDPEDPDFRPEPFSLLYQRSVYQSMRSLCGRVLQTLRRNIKRLPEPVQEQSSTILRSEQRILKVFQKFTGRKLSALRIRIHGDYHLGQVLFTGKDFVIIDFEGEPEREVTERRLKYSPFKDVAGMVRSFHYAIHSGLFREGPVRPEDRPTLDPWAELWYSYVSGTFLKSYLDSVGDAPFFPPSREEREIILKCYLLEKAVYELGYELNNRPEWVVTPMKGIQALLEGE